MLKKIKAIWNNEVFKDIRGFAWFCFKRGAIVGISITTFAAIMVYFAYLLFNHTIIATCLISPLVFIILGVMFGGGNDYYKSR